MKVLVIGGGGREHTLVWKLQQSPKVDEVICAPGNPGMSEARACPITAPDELAEFAARENIALTVVGPEAPLCAGIVDTFRAKGLRIFGPDAEGAQLEGSKSYAKAFMAAHGIPTGTAKSFTNEGDALDYLSRQSMPIVVKADGLAAGKGVIVAETEAMAVEAVKSCFSGVFGEAGSTVLIEECLIGEEASILALTDGKVIVPLASSQDHKRVGEGDTGPNTGGMGAYSPAPVVTDALWKVINEQVLDRLLKGCQADGLDFRGVIYAGVMVTEDGPKVLEFNVRFGDPETQAILPRLESDLFDAMVATVDGTLEQTELTWADDPAVCVVVASGGYPGPYAKGHVIEGIGDAEALGATVFHAGTSTDEDGNTITAGGRVLGVTCRGETIRDAIERVYAAVESISWRDSFFRRDIAHRALD